MKSSKIKVLHAQENGQVKQLNSSCTVTLHLHSLRYMTLPKLMSGEIRVAKEKLKEVV